MAAAFYKRRRDLLKLEESKHTERLARVIATADHPEHSGLGAIKASESEPGYLGQAVI
jgi:hypothetical protein